MHASASLVGQIKCTDSTITAARRHRTRIGRQEPGTIHYFDRALTLVIGIAAMESSLSSSACTRALTDAWEARRLGSQLRFSVARRFASCLAAPSATPLARNPESITEVMRTPARSRATALACVSCWTNTTL